MPKYALITSLLSFATHGLLVSGLITRYHPQPEGEGGEGPSKDSEKGGAKGGRP